MDGSLASPELANVDPLIGDRPEIDYVAGMELLLPAVQELSLAHDLADVQRIVRTWAREIVGCDGATFVLRDDGMCYYADEDAIAPLWKGSRFPMETCISGWCTLNREAVAVPDVYADDRIPHAAYRPTFVRSLVMVPIRRLDPVGSDRRLLGRPTHAVGTGCRCCKRWPTRPRSPWPTVRCSPNSSNACAIGQPNWNRPTTRFVGWR